MTIETNEELEGLKRSGRVVALTIQEMARHVRPGITTAELDEIGDAFLRKHGAKSAPRLVYDFPGSTCISVNDEAAHGIPGDYVIKEGDLVNIDVSAELDGYFTDSGAMVQVPPVSPQVQRLCTCTRSALRRAIAAVQPGKPINVIGQAVEMEARRCGFNIIQNLTGHGVGRSIHEEPHNILNYYDRRDKTRLTEGLVITIEPFFSTGAVYVVEQENGWTLKTPDKSLTAQYEHTLVVAKGKPIVVTAA